MRIQPDDDSDDRYVPYICKHGIQDDNCDECDDAVADIDKCLNCGKYKAGRDLNRDQVCSAGCRNPNEY